MAKRMAAKKIAKENLYCKRDAKDDVNERANLRNDLRICI